MTEVTIKVWDRTCPDCGSTNLDYLGNHCEGNKYGCKDCECEFITYLYEVLGEVEYRAEVVSKCQNCNADIVLTRHGDKATGTCDSCGAVIEEE